MLSLLAHSFVSRNNIRKHVITSPAQFRNHKNKNMSSLPTQISVMRNIIEKNIISPIRTALISDTALSLLLTHCSVNEGITIAQRTVTTLCGCGWCVGQHGTQL